MSSCLRIVTVVLALLFAGTAQRAERRLARRRHQRRHESRIRPARLGFPAWRQGHQYARAGSPADKAGLKNGDIILSIDRSVIDNSSDVEAYLAGKQPGTELRLQVLSGGRERRVTATLATRPGQQVGTQVVDANEVPYLCSTPAGTWRS